jgi:hypothetical protein
MKKHIISFSILVMTAAILNTGCKKSDLEDNYYNPGASVTADIPSLFSGLLFNETVIPRYWHLFTFQIPMMGTYSQTSGYTFSTKVYEQQLNYTQDRWVIYYTNTIARYREIEKHYNALTTDADKNGYLTFLETGRIFLYDQTSQIIDMWGDIPFTKAGGLNAEGQIILAGYDNAEEVYNFMLIDLKRISDYLATFTPDQFYTNQFNANDFLNKGSIDKWRRYCNSLLLRLAMRISYKNENAAKATVQAVLGNSTTYPLIENVEQTIQIKPSGITSNLVKKDEVRNGFGVNPFASSKMVDSIMVPTADPRLRTMFTANKRGEYHGVPNFWNAARVQDSTTANYFSRYDSTTITENNLLPGIVFTAAEAWFLKAEAFERWGGGDAKTAYENGIKQSIAFYYGLNALSDYTAPKDPMPSNTDIDIFLARPGVAYGTNNLEKIATQKWINFNVLQAQHAWAEWRRTKLPVLTFPNDPSSQNSPQPPKRLVYPSTEATLNATNYEAVKSKDNVNTKVFWDVR